MVSGKGTLVLRSRWLWQPNLIVFLSSACIMVLELVAGRIIAPYVGVSLYTWTSVIGIVLAGISLGNYVGGKVADKHASTLLLGTVFSLAGLASLGILLVDRLDVASLISWPLIAEILMLITALFFVPAAILGMISPIVAKLAVRDLAETGSTVGKIYASGTAGSIVGTFATGFFLISWFGTHRIVWGVGLILLAFGLLFLLGSRRQWSAPSMLCLALIGLALPLWRPQWFEGPCTEETNYFCIKVEERQIDGKPMLVLVLDRLVHSHVSLDNPTELVYDYEKAYAEITAHQAMAGGALRALFIGGGGYTFPRYMETVYPDSDLHVIEIDPGVTEIAYDQLGLSRDTGIVSYNEDARMFLERAPTDRFDLIFGDAFNDWSVPYHLTTREFNERVRQWLTDDGLYVVNIIDGARGEFLRAYLHTMRQTFAHVYLLPSRQDWRSVSRSTFVVIGTDLPLEMDRFAQATGPQSLMLTQLVTQAEVDSLLEFGESPVLLTDRYAPVDQMLTAVFRGRVPGR